LGFSRVEGDRFYWEEEAPKSRRARRLEREKKKRRAGLAELVLTVVVAFVLVFGVVRPFVIEAYRIPSESMVPTLEVGDRILANKFIYHFTDPKKGDIIVFDSVDEEDDQTLVKRVVGVAGDEIQVEDGVLFVNGEAQNEPYLNQELPFRGSYGPTEVPEGHIFVMGDNRGNSADSRVFGPLPLENVKGEAFVRFWPISKIGSL
jgi:signal peptidase I